MSKLLNKPTPTVAELAKKYKVSVLEVKKELMRGIKVEKEHTNNPKIAREIALDHLNEKLDYYKRLKKVDEETSVGSVRGLGNVTGDPAIGSNDYCNTNSLAYDPFNGARLKFIDKSHNKLHTNIFKAYNPKDKDGNKNFMNEGISAGPEREIPIIGDLTGSSRKVMKVDEVKLPKVPEKVKKKVKGAVAATMTAANIATGADIYDRASRGVGSPVRDVAAAASGLPGKIGYGAMATNWTVKGFDKAKEHIRAKKKQMKEQGSPVVPARYTERPMYEKKNGDVLPSGEIERGIYEMDTSSFSSIRPSTNIIDKRPGLSSQGISNAINTFKQNMSLRQSGMKREPGVGGSYLPQQSSVGAAIGAAADTARGIGQAYRDKLGLDMDKSNAVGAAKQVAAVATKAAFPVASAVASAVSNRMSTTKPTINPSSLPVSKASPASIPTVGGTTPPTLGSQATSSDSPGPSTPATPERKKLSSSTPQSASREGGLDFDQMTQDQSTKTPTDDDVKFNQNLKKRGLDEDMNEDWQSVNRKDKTDGLSQAAVNAYRRENPGSKLKTAVTEKNPTGKRAARRKSFCSRMGGMKKRLTSAKTARDPDSRINKALRRWNCEESVINELKAETLGSYISKSAKSRKKSLEGPKPDVKTWAKREHGIRTAIKKLTKEETKMENKDLINEALVNILENNLVDMKENLMVALQEKAMEKLEERKKEIAANYFAQ